jgi:hypothetical protein
MAGAGDGLCGNCVCRNFLQKTEDCGKAEKSTE